MSNFSPPSTVNETQYHLEEIRAGRTDSWNALDQRIRPQLEAALHGLVPQRYRSLIETRDLAQSAMLAAIHRLPTFEYQHRGSLRSWVLAIGRNKLVSKLRALEASTRPDGNRVFLSGEPGSPEPVSQELSPEAELEAASELADMLQTLATLPEDQKSLLARRFLNGETIDSLAESLRVSPRTIGRMIGGALREMQRQLDLPRND